MTHHNTDQHTQTLLKAALQDEKKAVVNDAINNNLRRVFGVTRQAAAYDVSTLDGKGSPDTKH